MVGAEWRENRTRALNTQDDALSCLLGAASCFCSAGWELTVGDMSGFGAGMVLSLINQVSVRAGLFDGYFRLDLVSEQGI